MRKTSKEIRVATEWSLTQHNINILTCSFSLFLDLVVKMTAEVTEYTAAPRQHIAALVTHPYPEVGVYIAYRMSLP